MLPHFLVASFFRSCIFFFQKFQLSHQFQPFILVDSVTSSSPTSSTLCPRPFLIHLGPATTLSIYLAFGCPRTWTTQRPLILLVTPPPPTQSVPSSVFSPISYILSSPSVSLPSFSVCLSRSVLCSMCICVLATSFPRNRCMSMSTIPRIEHICCSPLSFATRYANNIRVESVSVPGRVSYNEYNRKWKMDR